MKLKIILTPSKSSIIFRGIKKIIDKLFEKIIILFDALRLDTAIVSQL